MPVFRPHHHVEYVGRDGVPMGPALWADRYRDPEYAVLARWQESDITVECSWLGVSVPGVERSRRPYAVHAWSHQPGLRGRRVWLRVSYHATEGQAMSAYQAACETLNEPCEGV